MPQGRRFADVLDSLLEEPRVGTVPPLTYRPVFSGTPLYTLGVERIELNRFWATQEPYGATAPSARSAPPPTRAVRSLSPGERSALETFVRLGASLDTAFTARELRSAFRTLAQQYHPDRHPHAAPAETLRLGSAFADLAAAYGVLHEVAHRA
jgi:hypothetical protein